MIESKVDRKYNIWVMLALGLFSILASLRGIIQSYGEFFSGTPSDAVVAVMQIILFDGIIAVALSYIWAAILHTILLRTLNKPVISRFDFAFYYMFFLAIARAAMTIINSLQFAVPVIAVFCTYLSGMVFTTVAMVFYFFKILKKSYIPQGMRARGFLGFAPPILGLYALNYIMLAVLYGASGYFEPMLNELGYKYYYDPNELYAVIAGGAVLAIFIGSAVFLYFRLKKSDADAPAVEIQSGGTGNEKVFEEFDI